MAKPARCGLLVFGCLLAADAAQAEWLVNASIGADYNDNVPRAQLASDRENDVSWSLDVSPGYYFQLTDRAGLLLSAHVAADKFFEFKGLDNVSVGGAGALRIKLGLGAQAPWIRAAASVAHDDFDHRLRDAWNGDASLTAGMRVAERWTVQAGYFYEWRRADHIEDIPFLADVLGIGGEAWDIDAHNIKASGTFDINNDWTALFGYTRRMGEVTSTTRINGDIFVASDAIAPDTAIGPDRFAYRIDADTNIFSIGLSRALGRHASINAAYEYQDSEADGGLSYANHIGHVSLQFSY